MNTEAHNKKILEQYKKYAFEKYSSLQSARSRISTVNRFIEFINTKDTYIEQVEHSVVDEFLEQGLKLSLSKNTIRNWYFNLSAFFKFLKKQHYNLKIDYGKVNFNRESRCNFEVFKDDEIKELFELIDKDENKNSNRIIFKIMLYTGCTLKEFCSIQVFFQEKDIPDDEKYYIALDTKEICLNGFVKYILTESIMNDIKAHYNEVKLWYKEELPAKMPLVVCMHTSNKEHKKIVPLRYAGIQNRMTQIKSKSSFKDKNLSLKNFRHTVIKKMLSENQDLVYISKMMRIDITTLKSYIINDEQKEESEEFLHTHPFKEMLKN